MTVWEEVVTGGCDYVGIHSNRMFFLFLRGTTATYLVNPVSHPPDQLWPNYCCYTIKLLSSWWQCAFQHNKPLHTQKVTTKTLKTWGPTQKHIAFTKEKHFNHDLWIMTSVSCNYDLAFSKSNLISNMIKISWLWNNSVLADLAHIIIYVKNNYCVITSSFLGGV